MLSLFWTLRYSSSFLEAHEWYCQSNSAMNHYARVRSCMGSQSKDKAKASKALGTPRTANTCMSLWYRYVRPRYALDKARDKFEMKPTKTIWTLNGNQSEQDGFKCWSLIRGFHAAGRRETGFLEFQNNYRRLSVIFTDGRVLGASVPRCCHVEQAHYVNKYTKVPIARALYSDFRLFEIRTTKICTKMLCSLWTQQISNSLLCHSPDETNVVHLFHLADFHSRHHPPDLHVCRLNFSTLLEI